MGNFNFNASGQVSIFKITNNKKQLIETRSNAILPIMSDVAARLMGNYPIGKIDEVSIYYQTLNLATVPIISYNHPAVNQVQFSALFDEASFNGDYDELGLFASNMGKVAQLPNVNGTKTNADKLLITWTITIS